MYVCMRNKLRGKLVEDIYVYVLLCVYICVCVYICIHPSMNIYGCVYIFVWMDVRMNVLYMYVCMRNKLRGKLVEDIYVYVLLCVYIYVCVVMCIYPCMNVYCCDMYVYMDVRMNELIYVRMYMCM